MPGPQGRRGVGNRDPLGTWMWGAGVFLTRNQSWTPPVPGGRVMRGFQAMPWDWAMGKRALGGLMSFSKGYSPWGRTWEVSKEYLGEQGRSGGHEEISGGAGPQAACVPWGNVLLFWDLS